MQFTIGDTLRHARESSGISIQDAAHILRVRLSYLEALEEDTHEHLPGPAYIIGYLRSYARFLNLDPEPLVKRYRKGFQPEAPKSKAYPTPEPTAAKSKPNMTAYGISALMLALLYGGWYLVHREDYTPISPLMPVEAHNTATGTP